MAAEGSSRTRCFTASGLKRPFKWHLHFVVHKEGLWGTGLCAKWPASHRAGSKHPAQWASPLVLGMDGIFFHHSQAGLLFAVHKVFSNPSLEKEIPQACLVQRCHKNWANCRGTCNFIRAFQCTLCLSQWDRDCQTHGRGPRNGHRW